MKIDALVRVQLETRGVPETTLAVRKAAAVQQAESLLFKYVLKNLRDLEVPKRRGNRFKDGWIGTHNDHRIAIYNHLPESKYLYLGTGIFGPNKKYIRPRNSKLLRWVSPYYPGIVWYAKKVKGIKPDAIAPPPYTYNFRRMVRDGIIKGVMRALDEVFPNWVQNNLHGRASVKLKIRGLK